MNGFIRNIPELEGACRGIAEGGILALDTEFIWKRTYRPKLGIVQFAGKDGECLALDCLYCTNPAALGALIANPSVTKILHDARQDLEHLRHYTGAFPKNVFDTQLAAAFSGFPAGCGLQKLLLEAIGIGLPKTETLTDWTQRPLTDAQLEYALDDVRYLNQLRNELLARAEAFGTRQWLEEDLRKYDEPALYEDADANEAWKKVKTGRARLGGLGFAVLKSITAERERHARLWDIPKAWLGDDASLTSLALAAEGKGPGAKMETREVRFSHRLKQNFKRDALAAAYASAATTALALPEGEWPANPRPFYDDEVLDAADKAIDWLRKRGEEIHVDASVIANRAIVTAFVDNADDTANPLATGWRREVAGDYIEENFALA